MNGRGTLDGSGRCWVNKLGEVARVEAAPTGVARYRLVRPAELEQPRFVPRAADELQVQGVNAEVVDLRSLVPLDIDAVTASVKKTHRLLIVQEACLTGGFGAEVGCRVFESVYDYLDAPIRRLTAPDVPLSASSVLERAAIPDRRRIGQAALELVRG